MSLDTFWEMLGTLVFQNLYWIIDIYMLFLLLKVEDSDAFHH